MTMISFNLFIIYDGSQLQMPTFSVLDYLTDAFTKCYVQNCTWCEKFTLNMPITTDCVLGKNTDSMEPDHTSVSGINVPQYEQTVKTATQQYIGQQKPKKELDIKSSSTLSSNGLTYHKRHPKLMGKYFCPTPLSLVPSLNNNPI